MARIGRGSIGDGTRTWTRGSRGRFDGIACKRSTEKMELCWTNGSQWTNSKFVDPMDERMDHRRGHAKYTPVRIDESESSDVRCVCGRTEWACLLVLEDGVSAISRTGGNCDGDLCGSR